MDFPSRTQHSSFTTTPTRPFGINIPESQFSRDYSPMHHPSDIEQELRTEKAMNMKLQAQVLELQKSLRVVRVELRESQRMREELEGSIFIEQDSVRSSRRPIEPEEVVLSKEEWDNIQRDAEGLQQDYATLFREKEVLRHQLKNHQQSMVERELAASKLKESAKQALIERDQIAAELHSVLEEKKSDKETAQNLVNRLRDQVASLRAELDKNGKELETHKESFPPDKWNQFQSDLSTTQSDLLNTRSALSKAENDNQTLQDELASIKQQLDEALRSCSEKQNTIDELTKLKDEHDEEERITKEELEQLRQASIDDKSMIENLKEELGQIRTELDSKQDFIPPNQSSSQELDEKNAENKLLSDENTNLKSQLKTLADENTTHLETINRLERSLADTELQKKIEEGKLEETTKIVRELVNSLKQSETATTDLESMADDLNEQVKRWRNEAQRYKEKYEQGKTQQSRSQNEKHAEELERIEQERKEVDEQNLKKIKKLEVSLEQMTKNRNALALSLETTKKQVKQLQADYNGLKLSKNNGEKSYTGARDLQAMRVNLPEGTEFFYRLNLTFFNPTTKTFPSSTYEGPLRESKSMDSNTYQVDFNQTLHFTIPEEVTISLIAELVLIATDVYGRKIRECGVCWSVFPVSDQNDIPDVQEYDRRSLQRNSKRATGNWGTPRELFFTGDPTQTVFNEIEDCSFNFVLCKNKALQKHISLLPSFVILDEQNGRDSIAGFTSLSTQTILTQTFGGEIKGILDTLHERTLSPPKFGRSASPAKTGALGLTGGGATGKRQKAKIPVELQEQKQFYETVIKEENPYMSAKEEFEKLLKSLTVKEKKRGRHRASEGDDETLTQSESGTFAFTQTASQSNRSDSDDDSSRADSNSDSEDNIEIGDDDEDDGFLPGQGTTDWLGQPFWEAEDFDPKNRKKQSEVGKEVRACDRLAIVPRRRLATGYKITKGMAMSAPWLFGINLLKPLRQETMTFVLRNIHFYLPSGYDEWLRYQLEYVRKYQLQLTEDESSVEISDRSLLIIPHNSYNVLGEVITVPLAGGPVKSANVGRFKINFNQLVVPKSQPVVLKGVFPHPRYQLLFVVRYLVDVPLKVPQKLAKDGNIPAKTQREIWIGWNEYNLFKNASKYKTPSLNPDDESSDEEPENDPLAASHTMGHSTSDGNFNTTLNSQLSFSQLEGARMESLGSGTGGYSASELQMRKSVFISCPDLTAPEQLLAEKKVDPVHRGSRRLFLRRDPIFPLFFPGVRCGWVFDPTRGPLIPPPQLRPRGQIENQKGKKKRQTKTKTEGIPGLHRVPPSPVTLNTTALQKPNKFAPDLETYFPFDVLHPSNTKPSYTVGPRDSPTGILLSSFGSDQAPMMSFELSLPDVETYNRLPPFLIPPWKEKKAPIPRPPIQVPGTQPTPRQPPTPLAPPSPRRPSPPPPSRPLPATLPRPLTRRQRKEEVKDGMHSQFTFDFQSLEITDVNLFNQRLPDGVFITFRFFCMPRVYTDTARLLFNKQMESPLISDQASGSVDCRLNVDWNGLLYSQPRFTLPANQPQTNGEEDDDKKNVLKSLLPYPSKQSPLPDPSSLSSTLPEFLAEHTIQLDIVDSKTGRSFATAFLPLSAFVQLVDQTGDAAGGEGDMTVPVDLWSPLSNFSGDSHGRQTVQIATQIVQASTPSVSSFSHSMMSPVASNSLRALGRMTLCVSHRRVRSTMQVPKLISHLSKHQTGHLPERQFKQFGDVWIAPTAKPNVDSSSLQLSSSLSQSSDSKMGSSQIGSSQMTPGMMGQMRSLVDQSATIRQKRKQEMLDSLFVSSSSQTRVIFPSFAQPVLVDVPFTNPRQTDITLRLSLKVRSTEESSDSMKVSQKDSPTDELSVLNDEEAAYFRSVLAGGFQQNQQSRVQGETKLEEPLDAASIQTSAPRRAVSVQSWHKSVQAKETISIPLLFQSFAAGNTGIDTSTEPGVPLSSIEHELRQLVKPPLTYSHPHDDPTHQMTSVSQLLPFSSCGIVRDPLGTPFTASPRISPKILELSIQDAQSGSTLSLLHLVILPLSHHADKTLRITTLPDQPLSMAIEMPTIIQQNQQPAMKMNFSGSFRTPTTAKDSFVKHCVLNKTDSELFGSWQIQHTTTEDGDGETQVIQVNGPAISSDHRSGSDDTGTPYRFELALFNDSRCASLWEIWEVIVSLENDI
ncbi:hypothetical protein BLNAU_2511 [Blattamonas nauphoetae]|uniref:Uncharacterized protein n=1 Tax=Blattamonas nauphoetae TaxID=2049346 RepID=A0ABQ9YG49_9EUKA|nr:hypothetical protein BLNAU_2511 [Blattamonas nauphoetae]